MRARCLPTMNQKAAEAVARLLSIVRRGKAGTESVTFHRRKSVAWLQKPLVCGFVLQQTVLNPEFGDDDCRTTTVTISRAPCHLPDNALNGWQSLCLQTAERVPCFVPGTAQVGIGSLLFQPSLFGQKRAIPLQSRWSLCCFLGSKDLLNHHKGQSV